LALLSVLAVAGLLGTSRDKLVALVWPDADSEHARHALTQGLMSLGETWRATTCSW
jgi:DNA-binding SARP family transcriptional activator